MYIPSGIFWFLAGFFCCIAVAWVFSMIVENKDVDIEEDIRVFKQRIKDHKKKKLTKKELKSKLNKMFKD